MPDVIRSEADLLSQLAVAAPGKTVTVQPGTYLSTKPITPLSDVVYEMTGVTLHKPKGSGWAFDIANSRVHVNGVILDSDQPSILPIGANPRTDVHGFIQRTNVGWVWLTNILLKNIDTGFMWNPGSHHTIFENFCATDELRGDAFYWGGGDETLWRGHAIGIGVKIQNSQQEHPFRSSTVGCQKVRMYNFYFRNTCGKECASVRQGTDFGFYNGTFEGPVALILGEGGPTPSGATLRPEVQGCHWIGAGPMLTNKDAQLFLDIRYGVEDAKIKDCDMFVDATGVPGWEGCCISITPPAGKVTVSNITRYVKGVTSKPYIRDYSMKLIDLGGHKTVQVLDQGKPVQADVQALTDLRNQVGDLTTKLTAARTDAALTPLLRQQLADATAARDALNVALANVQSDDDQVLAKVKQAKDILNGI